jgi:7,8-dihydropterin-6-yl-methyl-4-(beta-D-ribofuranosyl)aminobenzene 5'-phosphate synthase
MFGIRVLCLCMILFAFTGNVAGEVASVDSITITTVYDNNPFVEGLVSSWGFSCVVQGLEKTILFDTGGDGEVLLTNMQQLALDPQIVQIVVLSHQHGDHTGGLADFLQANPEVTVYMLDSFAEHLRRDVTERGAQLVTVEEPVQICQGVFLTGEMGTAISEQALVLKTSQGLVIITGCAHPGIVDVVKKSQEIGKLPPYLVMGGFHLFGASRPKVREILSQFRELGVAKVSPCHCTGSEAISMFAGTYGPGYIQNGIGLVITMER